MRDGTPKLFSRQNIASAALGVEVITDQQNVEEVVSLCWTSEMCHTPLLAQRRYNSTLTWPVLQREEAHTEMMGHKRTFI